MLNILWRVHLGPGYLTSVNPAERDNFASDGQVFYTAALGAPGTQTLYRLEQQSIPDHMESGVPGEAGYSTNGVLANPWNQAGAPAATQQIGRVHNGNGYHATISAFESPPSGYGSFEGFATTGYSRYGNQSEVLLGIGAGDVFIASNAVAGGSIWSWSWNGVEFVNHDDYGREIQASLVYPDANGFDQNPTEAGDEYSTSANAQDRHGSPILNIQNNSSTVQITRSVPLDFVPDHLGGGPANPVAYTGMLLGKQLTLNYRGMGPVVDYLTTLTLPQSIDQAQLEIPTGYAPAGFDRFYAYDAALQAETVEFPPRCPGGSNSAQNSEYLLGSGYGGVIIVDHSGNAMGVYGVSTAVGGPVSYFTLWDFTTCYNTAKWSAVHGPASFPAGTTGYDVKIITGSSKNQVESVMRQLYLNP